MDFLAQLNSKISRKRSSELELAKALNIHVKTLAVAAVRRPKVNEALVTRRNAYGKEVRVRI